MPALPADSPSPLPTPILDALVCFSRATTCRDRDDRPVLLREAHDDLVAAINAHVEDRVREAIRLCNERYRTECRHDIMLDDEIVANVMGRPA